jgi:hypothetical protein
MDEDDPRHRRLTFWRGSDWKAPVVSQELFPDSPQPNFPTPEARYDYERGFAEREFRERVKTAGNWGFVRVPGPDMRLRNESLAAHQLSTVAGSFLDQSLRAYGDLLLDRELPPEEALRQFDEKAEELAEESLRDKCRPELAAMGIEESIQHIHFDRATSVIVEVRRVLAAILWEIAIEKPFANAKPGDEQSPQEPRKGRNGKKPVRRNVRYEGIDRALHEISPARPKNHEEVFRFLDDRKVAIPSRKPFKAAGGWLNGFQQNRHAASAWLSQAWGRLDLPAFARGPKK